MVSIRSNYLEHWPIHPRAFYNFMNLDHIKQNISLNLKKHLKQIIPNHPISEIYDYAIFPTGKLFRPLLVWSIGVDLTKDNPLLQKTILDSDSDFGYLASAIEIHHTYTLIHDDMPAMDNDDYRRGKLCIHKKYNEWKALLIGDGLAIGSFALLSKIKSDKMANIFKLFSWSLGPKGLIQGQVLDLSEEMNLSFYNLITTHKLKTARLIQTSILASYLLTTNHQRKIFRPFCDLFKMGESMGITFQLLDDLTELAEKKISSREQAINPWFNYRQESFNSLTHHLNRVEIILAKYDLPTFSLVLVEYFQKIKTIIQNGSNNIEAHFKSEASDEKKILIPIMQLLNRICHGQ